MVTIRVLLLFATIINLGQVSGQNCDLPTFDIIDELLVIAVDGISEDFAGFEVYVNSSLESFTLTCLSVSEMREQYRMATALVNFVFRGEVNELGSCHEGRPCWAFLNIECDDRTNFWIVNTVLIEQSLRVLGNSSTDVAFLAPIRDQLPRLDCGTCAEQIVLPLPTHDSNTNCFPCNSACQIEDTLSYCTGLTGADCCSFYELDVCVEECSGNRAPDENFDCVCTGNFIEPECTMCGLTCHFGIIDDECTQCTCDNGYTGSDCSIDINDCEDVTCVAGLCVDLVGNFTCNCAVGFIGRFCEVNIDDCVDVICNNGQCIDGVNDFECICDPDFTGEFCDQVIDNCMDSPCQNMGTCIDGVLNFTCRCLDNFGGQLCEQCLLDNCAKCSNRSGDCDECVGSFVNVDGQCVDPCSSVQCNNGTCIVSQAGVAECQCFAGFEGSNCETNINDCIPDPCLNDGVCIDGIASFTCICAPDFTGDMCETQINDCTPNTCLNGGTCEDGVNSFTCQCLPNFNGDTCQICSISNCVQCSTAEEGLCDTCETGYRQGRAGGCFVDLETFCSDATNPSQCQSDEAINQYNTVADRCGLDPPTQPDIPEDASLETRFNSNIDYFNAAYSDWLTEFGELSGTDTTGITVPTETEGAFIDRWRASFAVWVEGVRSWIVYYSDTVGFNVPPFPDVNIDTDDPEELYEEVTAYWSRINEQFAVEAGPICDSAA